MAPIPWVAKHVGKGVREGVMDYLLLGVSIILAVAGQILQKLAATQPQRDGVGMYAFIRLFCSLYSLAAVSCLGIGVFLWLIILSRQDLTFAYPLLSSSYVLITVYARFVLKEHVPTSRWVGVFVILCGIFLVTIK